MPDNANARQGEDEDTQIGLFGYVTKKAGERPEQQPEDRKRWQTGPERSPNQQDNHPQRKGKKRIEENRK